MKDQESLEFGSASNPRWAQTVVAVGAQTFWVWRLWAMVGEEWAIKLVADRASKKAKVIGSKSFPRRLTFTGDIAKLLFWL